MSMGSVVLVLTCTMAEVGNTRMCVQDVSWGVFSCDVCMLSVVLRPNTEPVDTESAGTGRRNHQSHCYNFRITTSPFFFLLPGMMTKEPWGSMATRQALRMLGVSAAEMPHSLHVSFRRLLRDCRFLLLRRILQSGRRWEHISVCVHACLHSYMFCRCVCTSQLAVTHSTEPSNDHPPRQRCHLHQAETPLPQLLQTHSPGWALFPASPEPHTTRGL